MHYKVENENIKYLDERYKTVGHCAPEYEGMSSRDAEIDYRRRVDKYRAFFEPIDMSGSHPVESKWSYFKCDHSRQHFVVHNVRGYLPMKIANFIMNLRTTTHSFYLTRHGQSEYNSIGRIGGDSGLSAHGLAYARALPNFVKEKVFIGPTPLPMKYLIDHTTSWPLL
jgi:6-phosphofructo-2-kinase/Histidine phosphatase superfamily (branch 1)